MSQESWVDLEKRNLALDSKPAGNDPTQQPLPPSTQRPINYENKPPLRKAMPSMNGHRPSRSREEEMRRRQAGQAGLRPAPALDIFADPPEVKRSLRPRRNSESSIADKNRMLSPEEERHRQDRRRRDREARRGPDGKLKPPSSSKRGNKQLDIIDKLDVSSIYGTGCKSCFDSSGFLAAHSIQYSTMMAPLMHVALTVIAKGLPKPPCKHSRKTQSTIHLAALAP